MRLPLLLVPFTLLTLDAPATAQTHPLPKTGEFVDSAGFAAVVRAQGANSAGRLVLSIVVDSVGRIASVRTFEAKVPMTVAAALADSLSAYARPQAAWSRGRWWLRLVVDVGPEPALRTERAQLSSPSLIGRPTLDPQVVAAVVRGQASSSFDISYQVLVAEDGSVLRVEPGPSLVPALMDQLRRDAATTRFRPGKVDGVPQPMWIEHRMKIEARVVR